MAENTVNLDIDTRPAIASARKAYEAMDGLKYKVFTLGEAIRSAFAEIKLDQYLSDTVKAGETLDRSLLVLRLNFGKLKAEIGRAAAPLGAVFIPMVNQAVLAATRLTRSVRKVMSALFGGSGASEDFAEETQNAAEAQTSLVKASSKVKRTLAGFDEITRLGDPGGSNSSAVKGAVTLPKKVDDTLSPQLQAIVDKILALIAPLKAIDLTPAVTAFGKFKEALTPISRELFAGLEWAWFNLLVPLAKWTIEDLLPAFLNLLSGALQFLHSVIVALKPLAIWLWENFLKPLAQWAGGVIVDTLNGMAEKLGDLSIWITENQDKVQDLINLAQWLAQAWEKVSGAIAALPEVWNRVKNTWNGATSWFREKIWNPVQNGFKQTANAIIGFLNGAISGAVKGINGIIKALNTINFDIPWWIPGIGGMEFGFQLKAVTAPQIPYLAKGAVLPANKPFMAIVGDQKHGTNVEAPLATIQEAVALVMGDQTAALVAGFEASIGVQREILQAVLGISVGDDVIGQAVARYNRKMAVVKGV